MKRHITINTGDRIKTIFIKNEKRTGKYVALLTDRLPPGALGGKYFSGFPLPINYLSQFLKRKTSEKYTT
jgi:hypothetical protein